MPSLNSQHDSLGQSSCTSVKSVGSTPVQCVDHLVPLCSELFRFLSLGLELSGDLPLWSVFALTILAGLGGMWPEVARSMSREALSIELWCLR